MRIENDWVAVEWVNLGEGHCGDFDSADPEDENLLRFDVLQQTDGEWFAVDDSSYCTQVPASTDEPTLAVLLAKLFSEVVEPVTEGHSIKKLCERLSWIAP